MSRLLEPKELEAALRAAEEHNRRAGLDLRAHIQALVAQRDEMTGSALCLAAERDEVRERAQTLEGVVAKFREAEWARGDWQGFCPFRRHKDVMCLGTDGRVGAVGTPTPVPHSEACPYHALNALALP
jgi:hypothetical protein